MSRHQRRFFRSRAATLVLVLTSLLISLLAAVLALELFIRFQYPMTTLYQYAPGMDYVMEPSRVVSFGTDEFRIEIRTNSYGLRDDEPDLTSEVRILLLGDSFTFGHGVEHQETFGYLLEEALNLSLQRSVDIINTGHNGYDTRRELAYFKERGDLFSPTMVMIGVTLNDVFSNSGDYFFSPISLGILRNFPVRAVQSLAEYLKKPSRLLRKLGLRDSETANDAAIDHFDCLRDNGKCRAGWEATLSYLSEIKELTNQRNLSVLLINIPLRDQIVVNPARESYSIAEASYQLQQFSRSLGFHFVDLAACETLNNRSYFERDGHWNANGHATAARCIHEQFQKNWLN